MISEPGRPTGRGRWLIGVGLVVLALNLRPAVNGVGAVMPELRHSTGLTGTAAGLLLGLPTLCFALLGLTAPAVAHRFGTHRTVLLALLALLVGQLIRSILPGLPWLFAGSLVTLTGVAIANVLMPGLVRLHFPDHITVMTAVYTTVLSAGGAIAAGVTLPLEHALGGDWQLGIGLWASVVLVALVPWVPLAIRPPRPARTGPTKDRTRAPARSWTVGELRRSPLAWVMAGYFGTQALQAYVMFGWLPEILISAGKTDTAAALQVSLLALVGVVVAAVVPLLLARVSVLVLVIVMAAGYQAGYIGLMIAPATDTWLWSCLIGLGTGAFPVALTLVALRARTTSGTTALSAFTQSVGYLIASTGPFLFGVLHDLVGGWTVSLLMLSALLVVHLLFGLRAARTRYVEDELIPPSHRQAGGHSAVPSDK